MKKSTKIIVAIAAISATTVLALQAYNYVQYTLPPSQVDILVKYSPDENCRDDNPLYIKISNGSHRKINNSSFILSAKKDNDGENLIQVLSRAYSRYRIIRSGEVYEGCWAYPKLITNKYAPEELTFEIRRKVISFED